MPTTLSIELNEMQRLDAVSDTDALGNASTFYQDYIDTLKKIKDLKNSADLADPKVTTDIENKSSSLSSTWKSFTETLEGAFDSDVWEQEGSEMTEYLKGKAEDIANG